MKPIRGALAFALTLPLAACAGQRPTLGPPPTSDTADLPAETCTDWTTQRFKGGDDPEQVHGARLNWVGLLLQGQVPEPDDTDIEAVTVGLSPYCATHPDTALTDAAGAVLAYRRGR